MRLIDANKLKEKAVPLLFPTNMESCGHIPVPVQAVVVAEIEQTPTIEAEPVRHGRWKKKFETYHDTHTDEYWEEEYFSCSICWKASDSEHNYCPNCGANMRGDTDE